MKIHNGIKKINPADNNKKPLIFAIEDSRKIIITKNKKETKDGIEQTYYSYQLNIPREYLMLIQDDYDLIKGKKFIMYLLEVTKKHYIIKLAPYGVQNILSIPNVYGVMQSFNFIEKMQKQTQLSKEQIDEIIEIVTSEIVRDQDKIAQRISDELNVDKADADNIYDTFLKLESKIKRNVQFTLPKKDIAYLQAYDKYYETIEQVNLEHEKKNEIIKDMNQAYQEQEKLDEMQDLLPLFDAPVLYVNMVLMQKFNINGLYFEYELHLHINTDVDKDFVEFVKNDESNPGGIPGWLETLIIDWNDPKIQKLLGIENNIKDYDLTDYGVSKYKVMLDE